VLKGSTSKEERTRLVRDFNAGGAQVFLISLKAGGTGLNLTAADVVIHYDPWWNQAAQDQATDRAHRIGQHACVQVYKLIAKDTVEERILEMQAKKASLLDSVSGDEEQSILSMTREELLALLE
ncbi:MAG: helicase-related protein, partial [Eubacteriales bacterium]